ncbi:MAG: hypothetical protein OH337_03740 [Candidatus Parvarchaeota archaeon]|nr:hypothetical protein [Candidatus Haiyanarchaeum thermophilum]
MNLEVAGLKGEFEIYLYDSEKRLKEYRRVKNITVNSGFRAVCDMMGLGGVSPFNYCAIGTGTTAPSPSDTALANEIARVLGGYTRTADNVWKNDATFGAGVGTGAITESGLFNASTGGTMLCRQTFPVINKGANDTLVVTWQYTLS